MAVAGSQVLVATPDALQVFDLAKHIRIGSLRLPHAPTDVAVRPDGRQAAVTLSSGRLVLLSKLNRDPAHWHQDSSTIELDRLSGLQHRGDPRPDQVAYSPDGHAIAITLPYNDGVTIVQASDGGRIRAISAGAANVTGVDTRDDGAVSLTGNLWTQTRQPTGVAWIDDGHLASSSPGTRSWSVYDVKAGKLTWDSGTGFEYRAVESGVYSDASSADGGSSPDTVAVARLGGTAYALIGAKHGNFVAGYSLADPDKPIYRQLLPTPAAAPISVSHDAVVAGGTNVFVLKPGAPAFPALQSTWTRNKPLGWDGTTGLAADQFHAERLFTRTGGHPTQILDINASTQPAKIDTAIPLTEKGKPYGLRAAGLYQRSDGRFLIAATGKHATDNRLVVADQNGNVTSSIDLPSDVTRGLSDTDGLGGISGFTINGTEYIWVVFKRPLPHDPDGVFRIGRYDPDHRSWTWFGYRPVMDRGSVELGDIDVLDQHRVALIEQDHQTSGASTAQLTTISVPTKSAAAHDGLATILQAQPASDLASTVTRAGDPLPTAVTGLVTAGNDHGFLLADAARDTADGSQPELADLGVTATAFPEHTTALGTTLASWLLPLSGVIIIGIGCLVAAGIALRSRFRRRPRTITI